MGLREIAVFDWWVRKPSQDERAYKMGQDLGTRLVKAFEAYKERRLAPTLQRYLDIFREQLQQAIKNEDRPPYYSAKAESEAFGTNLAVLKHQMYAEMSEAVADWLAEYPEDNRNRNYNQGFCLWINATTESPLKRLWERSLAPSRLFWTIGSSSSTDQCSPSSLASKCHPTEQRTRDGDDQFRNQICCQIGKVVERANITPDALTIVFEDHSSIIVSLREVDFPGPEAALLHSSTGVVLWVAQLR
jgi:hypothetical protein